MGHAVEGTTQFIKSPRKSISPPLKASLGPYSAIADTVSLVDLSALKPNLRSQSTNKSASSSGDLQNFARDREHGDRLIFAHDGAVTLLKY